MTVRPSVPYVLTAVGLGAGLVVLLFDPLPAALNPLVGGACLAVAVASVAFLVVAGSGPGERGPDF